MKPTNPQSNGHHHLQKWGLFVLLAGSLGFNLSMNPDHFNNIARNEGGSGVFELASDNAPAAKSYDDLMKERTDKLLKELQKLKHNGKPLTEKHIDAVLQGMADYNNKKTSVQTGVGDVMAGLIKVFGAAKADQFIKQIPADVIALPKKEKQTAAAKTEKAPADKAAADKAAADKAAADQDAADKLAAHKLQKEKDNTNKSQTPAKPAATADKNQPAASPAASADKAQASTAKNKPDADDDDNDDKTASADGNTKLMTKDELRDLIAKEVADAIKREKLLPPSAQTLTGTAPGAATPPPAAANPPATGSSETATPNTAATPTTPPVNGTPPNQAAAKPYEYNLGVTKGYCVISIELENGKTVGKAKSSSQGQACHLDNQKKELTSSIGDLKGAQSEILAWMNGKAEEEVKEKSRNEIAKEFWEKASKRCKIKGMDMQEKLECHQENLTKLSNDLDDSSESKNIVRKYFQSSLLPTLRAMMAEPTTDPFTLQIDSSKLDGANEIAKSLLENMNGDNSEGVTALLGQLKGGSYSAQASHARNMFLSAQEDKKSSDFFTQQLGYRKEMLAKQALNPSVLGWQAIRDRGEWMDALSNGSNPAHQSLIQTKFYAPTQAFIGTLPKLESYNKLDTNKVNVAALELSGMNFPDISGLGMNAATGSLFTPGLSSLSTFPMAMLDSRQNYNRGRNLLPVGPVSGTTATPGTVVNGKVVVPASAKTARGGTPRTAIVVEQNY